MSQDDDDDVRYIVGDLDAGLELATRYMNMEMPQIRLELGTRTPDELLQSAAHLKCLHDNLLHLIAVLGDELFSRPDDNLSEK